MKAALWLKNRWELSGINNGDIILLHSNIVRTLGLLKQKGYSPSVELVLESFLEAVGSEGTLIVPTFNFEFTKGTPFDIRTTKSQMGVLTEVVRNHPNSVRTGHPIYSFCVIGKHTDLFANLKNKSAFGKDSPFDMVRKLDGKIGVLDLSENDSVTFHHHTEEMMAVDYRYQKQFSGLYTDINGIQSHETFYFFVRDLNGGVERCLDILGCKLWEKGIYSGYKPAVNTGLRVANANQLFHYVSEIIRNNDALGILYTIKKRDAKYHK